nr:hypothetical protein [Mucilaginibacter sp. FT3.2]
MDWLACLLIYLSLIVTQIGQVIIDKISDKAERFFYALHAGHIETY